MAPVEDCFSDNEWSTLREVIVGRAANSQFPSEPAYMIKTVCPPEYTAEFRKGNPFPADIVAGASKELDNLASTLESMGIVVHRPRIVDWSKVGGYTGAMPRDRFMVVGNHIIESCFAWKSRRTEVEACFGPLREQLAKEGFKIIRAPLPPNPDTIYDGCDINNGESLAPFKGETANMVAKPTINWAINNSRPAFDVADFIRVGKSVFGQLSNVTNQAGLDYVAANLPEGYQLCLPKLHVPKAMHIDTTLIPLRQGFALYDSRVVTEDELRRFPPFDNQDWTFKTLSFVPKARDYPPLYMTSAYICMNVLSIDNRRVLIEEKDDEMAEFLTEAGMEVIRLSFKHVNCLGGAFHCATVDLKRARD